MAFEVSYDFAKEGITVPYPPIKDDIRHNRGFVDLRGSPKAAKEIEEANESPALRSILVKLATPGCSIATLGCDLGRHEEPELPIEGRHVAGGYVQVASLGSSNVTTDMCERYAEAVVGFLSGRVRSHWWRVAPTFCWVHSYLTGDLEKVPSVWFWFWCLARSPDAATASRERFLVALNEGLTSKKALAGFKLPRAAS